MTSSFRATGSASVRGTPVASDAVTGAWALAELSLPVVGTVAPSQATAEDRAAAAAAEAKERARVIDEAYARGLADGEKKAGAAAQKRIADAVMLVDTATAQLRDAASIAPEMLEENIAALAVIVARQVVARAVTVDRELVADLVRRALTEFPIEQTVRIRIHPLDLSVLTMGGGGPTDAPITGSREVTWFADPRVARGGCMIEGRERIIDGRVDTALERAYKRMATADVA
ncbi:MAG TPA: FliH/SctL family protein [Gemmatimonadaceae bacterium]|jgi:flagellar biosynthesis/type III secretory pathway protein FliH|nr:FliH/SctL family protein [Gemmatimonadaceae bacterium]